MTAQVTHRLHSSICLRILLGFALAAAWHAVASAAGPASQVVFPLRALVASNPCEEITDTPSAESFTRAVSRSYGGGSEVGVVASPAEGTESAPGVFLSITAAARDREPLLFQFILVTPAGEVLLGQQWGVIPSTADRRHKTAKLNLAALPDGAVHQIKVRTIRDPDLRTVDSAPVFVLDPREKLRRELAGMGFASIEGFRSWIAPIIERSQADFRVHGWGSTAEAAFYAANQPGMGGPPFPVSYMYSGMGGGSGPTPLLLNGRESPPGGLTTPPDVSGILLRHLPWVEGAGMGEGLGAGDEATGEYFANLLNAESGMLGLNAVADLVRPPMTVPGGDLLPSIYSASGDACFPRQNTDEFLLPDAFFFDSALEVTKTAAFAHLGFLPAPPNGDVLSQDLADTARLFNDQTANLMYPAAGTSGDGHLGARHRPQIPRVSVIGAVNDGLSRPVTICWSFTDPHCDHTPAAAELLVDGATTINLPGSARYHSLTGLAAGLHTVRVRVLDSAGFMSERIVLFVKP